MCVCVLQYDSMELNSELLW